MKTPNLTHLPLFASDEKFAVASRTVAGITGMFADAKTAGYHIVERSRWRTGSMNRHGIVRVEDTEGTVVWVGEWDVGSQRRPAENFRITSRHGRCLLAALGFIRARVLAAQ